jgi:hypothetical protein
MLLGLLLLLPTPIPRACNDGGSGGEPVGGAAGPPRHRPDGPGAVTLLAATGTPAWSGIPLGGRCATLTAGITPLSSGALRPLRKLPPGFRLECVYFSYLLSSVFLYLLFSFSPFLLLSFLLCPAFSHRDPCCLPLRPIFFVAAPSSSLSSLFPGLLALFHSLRTNFRGAGSSFPGGGCGRDVSPALSAPDAYAQASPRVSLSGSSSLRCSVTRQQCDAPRSVPLSSRLFLKTDRTLARPTHSKYRRYNFCS